MNDFTEIKIFADGRTEPYLSSGSAVILVQSGTAEVGKLIYSESSYEIHIEHPLNSLELARQVLATIKNINPECLAREQATLLKCPQKLTDEMIW